MNQAEELAAAEALNQLRARRKTENDATPPASACAAPQAAPAVPSPPASLGDAAARSQSPPQYTEQARTPLLLAGAEAVSAPPYSAADPNAAGSQPPRSEHLRPVLNTFPPSVGGASSASASSASASSASAPLPAGPVPPNRPWRNVLLTATSMMLTKDARKKLRQLLAVLRLASEHLNSRVSALQAAMDADASSDGVKPKISKQAIRHDIITTIKKCLAMISTLATNSLPAVARDSVRNTILRLPSRWASQMEAGTASKEGDGETESAILALATETLVSIRNITLIISETMDRADNWVERLPRFKRGKRQRDEEEDDGAAPTDGVEVAGGGPTRSSSTSSLQAALPVTRPSSPEADDDKMPSPKAIKVTDASDEKSASSPPLASAAAVPTQ